MRLFQSARPSGRRHIDTTLVKETTCRVYAGTPPNTDHPLGTPIRVLPARWDSGRPERPVTAYLVKPSENVMGAGSPAVAIRGAGR